MEPTEILANALARASASLNKPLVNDVRIADRIKSVALEKSNRSGIRVLLACALAKAEDPGRDIRRPYDSIGDAPSATNKYSGRTIDTKYITPFRNTLSLPFISTTAFLTPAWRTKNITLAKNVDLKGEPAKMYADTLQIFDDIEQKRVQAEDVLAEAIRLLLIMRNERDEELKKALATLKKADGEQVALSAETIVTLVEQHIASPKASRLPVLVIAAAYSSASKYLQEQVLPLQAHNAADVQTGAWGDVEITLLDDDDVITAYEMKDKRVTKDDIDEISERIAEKSQEGIELNNFIVITTWPIDKPVQEYAATMYEKTGGIEIAVLDCISFLRYFLHLFHRLRMRFLDEYQKLVLAEEDNTVRPELKLSLLALRKAAESGQPGT